MFFSNQEDLGTLISNPSNYSATVDPKTCMGQNSSDGIANRHGLESVDRIPVEANFSAPIKTGPEAHPISYAVGITLFLGAKWPGRGVNHPSLSSTEVKKRVELELCVYSLSTISWPVIGRALPLPLPKGKFLLTRK
jgi:hypothetical protein